MKIINAVIDGTMLGVEDHGIMSAFVYLSYNGSGQGFGGYALDSWSEREHKRVPHSACGTFIAGVLRVAGAETWEKLKGKSVRVKKESDNGPIIAMGHFLRDDWFEPGKDMS